MANPPSLNDTDVLIVGAGPTGLVLALWLTRLGYIALADPEANAATVASYLEERGIVLMK